MARVTHHAVVIVPSDFFSGLVVPIAYTHDLPQPDGEPIVVNTEITLAGVTIPVRRLVAKYLPKWLSWLAGWIPESVSAHQEVHFSDTISVSE